jgi:hypothetical protein
MQHRYHASPFIIFLTFLQRHAISLWQPSYTHTIRFPYYFSKVSSTMIMSRFSLGSLVAVAMLLAAAHGFTTTTNTPTRILHNNNIKRPPASHLHLHNDCHPSCTRTVLYSSSTVSDQHESSILEQARRVLATMEDDAEYQSHYHPYKDEDEQLQQAQYWLQQVLNANKEEEDEDEAEDIAERLQRKVETFERRIAKRQG